jgi:hypothetical protein
VAAGVTVAATAAAWTSADGWSGVAAVIAVNPAEAAAPVTGTSADRADATDGSEVVVRAVEADGSASEVETNEATRAGVAPAVAGTGLLLAAAAPGLAIVRSRTSPLFGVDRSSTPDACGIAETWSLAMSFSAAAFGAGTSVRPVPITFPVPGGTAAESAIVGCAGRTV